MMARASELEKENAALRKQLENAEARLEELEEKMESTATGHAAAARPARQPEQVSILEEAIDSRLRSNTRREASDEEPR